MHSEEEEEDNQHSDEVQMVTTSANQSHLELASTDVLLPSESGGVADVTPISSAKTEEEPREWTSREQLIVLIGASVAGFLQPIATTVYTPVLPIIRDDLGCTNPEIIATISVYLGILGFMPMIWGPFSDAYGRKRAIVIACLMYCVTMLACAFTWDVYSLLAMRALQAVAASAGLTVGSGAIADTHPKEIRGRAMGYYLMGPLVGPIIGPTIGGLIAQFLGWRSIFLFLSGLSAVVLIFVWCLMPETLPPLQPGQTRRMANPLGAFKYFRYGGVTAVTALAAWVYCGFYAIQIAVPYLLKDRYQLSPMDSGFAMMPTGVGLMLGSTLGGRAADYVSKGGKPTVYRLISTCLGQIAFIPFCIAFGWLASLHLAFLMVVCTLTSFFFTFPRPGISTYSIETVTKRTGKNVAGTVTGLQYSVLYMCGAISSQISLPAVDAIGYGWFFTIVGGGVIFFIMPVAWITYKGVREHQNQLSPDANQTGLEMGVYTRVLDEANDPLDETSDHLHDDDDNDDDQK